MEQGQNSNEYQFTNSWFTSTSQNIWDQLLAQLKPTPTNILEIGSYEGASTSYLIEVLSKQKSIELHCVDTWEGGLEHSGIDMYSVEQRFLHNTNLAISRATNSVNLNIHRGYSDVVLAKLLAEGKQGYFDFVYVDGSHQAPDVLCDAILSFKLVKKLGIIVFDDYLWSESLSYGIDPIRSPKIAIDAFTNIFCRKIRLISAPLYQLYVQKIID